MVDPLTDTEQKILDAAQSVFTEKGMAGARMQAIADKAGINKALLHYYYRSKEKLFTAVFKTVIKSVIPKAMNFIDSDRPLSEKITQFCRVYMELFEQNPKLPLFVMSELNRHPEGIVSIVMEVLSAYQPNPIEQLKAEIKREVKAGNIQPVDANHLVANMLSMCIMPFAGRHLLQRLFFNGQTNAYEQFLTERKTTVPAFIINAIQPNRPV